MSKSGGGGGGVGGTSCANAPMQFNSFEKIWEQSVLYLLDLEQHGWKML